MRSTHRCPPIGERRTKKVPAVCLFWLGVDYFLVMLFCRRSFWARERLWTSRACAKTTFSPFVLLEGHQNTLQTQSIWKCLQVCPGAISNLPWCPTKFVLVFLSTTLVQAQGLDSKTKLYSGKLIRTIVLMDPGNEGIADKLHAPVTPARTKVGPI